MNNIPQYPKYSVSKDGLIVFNNESGKALKQAADKAGYVWVTLLLTDKDYKIKRVPVHRMVAFTYLGPPGPDQVWVNHKDGNKANNHFENLEWSTISENIKHSFEVLKRKARSGAEHWNFGMKVGKVTRNRMSKKKIGELHPKFKGWYLFKDRRFNSLNEAGRITGVDRRKIKRLSAAKKYFWSFIPK